MPTAIQRMINVKIVWCERSAILPVRAMSV